MIERGWKFPYDPSSLSLSLSLQWRVVFDQQIMVGSLKFDSVVPSRDQRLGVELDAVSVCLCQDDPICF